MFTLKVNNIISRSISRLIYFAWKCVSYFITSFSQTHAKPRLFIFFSSNKLKFKSSIRFANIPYTWYELIFHSNRIIAQTINYGESPAICVPKWNHRHWVSIVVFAIDFGGCWIVALLVGSHRMLRQYIRVLTTTQ